MRGLSWCGWPLILALAMAFAGCADSGVASQTTEPVVGDKAATAAALCAKLPRITSHVCDALSKTHLDAMGATWGASLNNELPPRWLIETPLQWDKAELTPVRLECPANACAPGKACSEFGICECDASTDCGPKGACRPVEASVRYPGESPRSMCVGHSDFLYDELYQMVIATREHLDLTNLWLDGSFRVAMRNGLQYLNRLFADSSTAPDARILLKFDPDPQNVHLILDDLTKGITDDVKAGQVDSQHVRVTLAVLGPLTPWTHSKIVIRDGVEVVTGGHNWSSAYFEADADADISMKLYGSAADQTQDFVNLLWGAVCNPEFLVNPYTLQVFSLPRVSVPSGPGRHPMPYCRDYKGPLLETGTSLPVLSVATTGGIGAVPSWFGGKRTDHAGDDAIYAMIDAAETSIYMNNAFLGEILVYGPSPKFFDHLGQALARGVNLYLVASSPSRPAEELRDHIRKMSLLLPEGYTSVDQLMCDRIHFGAFTRVAANPPQSGDSPYFTHAKFIMVDDQAFYVGSQNTFPGDLSDGLPLDADVALGDHGFIVEDPATASYVKQVYWDSVWSRAATRPVDTFCPRTPCGNAKLTSVALGVWHSCGVCSDGHVSCWGANYFYQMAGGYAGVSGGWEHPVPNLVYGVTDAVEVAAAEEHTCARRAGGGVLCWGTNFYGEVGDPGTTDPYGYNPTPVFGLNDAVEITAGDYFACARHASGGVSCWGSGGSGQLGNGALTDSSSPVPVQNLADAVQITAGYDHACARRSNGTVVCWGYNGDGEFGDGTTTSSPVPAPAASGMSDAVDVAAGAYHTCFRRQSGEILCSGYPYVYGGALRKSPVDESGLSDAVQLSGGVDFNCARQSGGNVSCWGAANNTGHLGDGTKNNSLTLAVPVKGLVGAIDVATGDPTACAATVDGQGWCWGDNNDGQLGDGTYLDSTTPVSVAPLPEDCVGRAADGHCNVAATLAPAGGSTTFSLLCYPAQHKPASCGEVAPMPERAFAWTPSKTGTATLTLLDNGSNGVQLEVYTSQTCLLTDELSCNHSEPAVVSLPVTAGTTYYIVAKTDPQTAVSVPIFTLQFAVQ